MCSRIIILLSAFLCSLSTYASSGLKDVELRDLYFGEILYYAYQDLHFDALSKLDSELSQYYKLDEVELDTLHSHRGQAEFSVGDMEMQYRMSKRATMAIQAVLGEGIDLAIRNQAALALARIFYKKNDPQGALYALDLIKEEPDKSRYDEKYSLDVLRGKEPETFKQDVDYLRALASIDTGQFNQAVKLLQSLQKEKTLKGYVSYNLGIALIQAGNEEEAIKVLDELGRIETNDDDLLAIKDKTNLKLAYRFIDDGNTKQAKKYFERVRLDGPYSNKALLGVGWVAVAQGRFDRALVPWSMLHERAETNSSVQEVLMAVPYAYGKLQAHGKAANLYDHAMDIFAKELISLDDSIKSIRTNKFLDALLDKKADKDKNWVVNLRELPDTPETRYILELMASHDFQNSYKNYKDLADLQHYLDKWLADLRVYEEMIEIRRVYQEPLLPVVDEQFKKIDAKVKLRLEQRDSLSKKLKNMLIAPRPEYLATADERLAMDRLTKIEENITTNPGTASDDLNRRVDRLRGVLLWRVNSEYDQRLTDAYNHLISLDDIIKQLKIRHHAFIRTRQAATQSYEGYLIPIRQLRTRLFAAQRELKGVMAKQGRMLETMAINELDRRRKRLEDYQIKARFALAESYDRATKAQVDEEILQQNKLLETQQEEIKPTVEEDEKETAVKSELVKEASLTVDVEEQQASFKEKLMGR